MRDYEQIYVPQRLGGDSEISQVTGTVGESGETQIIQTDTPMLREIHFPIMRFWVNTKKRNDIIKRCADTTGNEGYCKGLFFYIR